MNFLTISILAYTLNGGVVVVDKILLKHSIPNPAVYTFYISVLGLISLLLIPLGTNFNSQIIVPGIISGITATFAVLTLFESLRLGEASVSAPLVGALNPFFTLILGSVFLNEVLTQGQLAGFFAVLLGATVLTFNLWFYNLRLNKQAFYMVFSGLLFAISYLFLKEVFQNSNFITGLIFTRITAAAAAVLFLFPKKLREEILGSKTFKSGSTSTLLFFGQSMGAAGGLLLAYATSLASPALVNSLFGVQYLVILGAAIILGKNYPSLLDERLNTGVLLQKITGAGILSLGVYLLSSST